MSLADNEAANIALAHKLIDLTKAAGADAADVLVSDSASLSVSCRMGQLEDSGTRRKPRYRLARHDRAKTSLCLRLGG